VLTYTTPPVIVPVSMFIYKTSLKPSPIHGLGVFAWKGIRKGSVVYQHRPELDQIFSANEFANLDRRDQALILHYGGLDKRLNRYRLPYDNLRFLNHSDTPNLVYVVATDQIVALRAIAAGEELTQNYRDFEDGVEFRIAKSVKNPNEEKQ